MTRFLRGAWLLFASLIASSVHAAEPQVTDGFINAPVAEVWRLFTTAEGFDKTGAGHTEIDLRIGGSIPSHYGADGALGGSGTALKGILVNEILAYEPERMLAIRIKAAPASFPYRAAMQQTWSVVYFTPAGADMTHVRIVGLGYADDPESIALREFLAAGNRKTLDTLAKLYWPTCALCKQDSP